MLSVIWGSLIGKGYHIFSSQDSRWDANTRIHMRFRNKNDELSLSILYIKYMNIKLKMLYGEFNLAVDQAQNRM